MSEITLTLPAEIFEAIVAAVTERVLAALAEQGSNGWFTVADAARYIGASETHLRRLLGGAIAYSQEDVGCKILVARRDLDAYLNERKRGAP